MLSSDVAPKCARWDFALSNIHGFHCDHSINVSHCPCWHCSYLTFSSMLHVHGRFTRTANIGTQQRRTWIVSELMACSACGLVSFYCKCPANKHDCEERYVSAHIQSKTPTHVPTHVHVQ